MADNVTINKLVSFETFVENERWIHDYIDQKDAKSLKSVALSTDSKKLLFYKIETPTADSVPAFEIEIPQTSLDSVIPKMTSATEGNVVVAKSDGSVKDSGIAVTDVATKNYVDTKISEEIVKQGHLSKQLVTALPLASEAKENIIYMIKIDSATGDDKYEEWILISGELVCIGSTSTDLSGYYTQEQIDAKIAEAKQQAISDAVSQAATDATQKANQALADAKAYTDQEFGKLNTRLGTVETDVTTMKGNINTINSTLASHEDRIKAVEDSVAGISVATNEEHLTQFNNIFYPA